MIQKNEKTPIKKEIRPQSGPQERFLSSPADIVIYGGAAGGGKTFGLLMDPLRHIKTVKGFGAVIFRRETPQITNEGGLLDESKEIYYSQGGQLRESPKIEWSFPPYRNKIHFDHLQYDKTVNSYDGAQICLIGFDQLEHFSEHQFFYLLSRNRSTCGIRPCIRATANPDADSWLARFISWWIDQDTGYPIDERGGVLRWFVRDGGQIVWGDSKDDLEREYNVSAKSVTFIPAKLSDNPILEQVNPEYRGNLQALSFIEQERLLHGNWKIRAEGKKVFNREWFEVIDRTPPGLTKIVRFWDMASTKKSKKSADPDYTAGLKMGITGGIYYVLDLFRIRDNPGAIEAARAMITNQDGPTVKVREEQEGGASGKTAIFLAARDQFRGYDYLGVPGSGSKEARAVPASRAAYNGLIKVVRAPWNDAFFAEVEAFPDGKHDDIVDALSGAFNDLASTLRNAANEPTAAEAVVSVVEDDHTNFFGEPDNDLGDIW